MLARATELPREETPDDVERTVANDRAAGIDAQRSRIRSGYRQAGIGAICPQPPYCVAIRHPVVPDHLSAVVDADCSATKIRWVYKRQDGETAAVVDEGA